MIWASVYQLVFIENLLVHLAEKILLMQPLKFGGITLKTGPKEPRSTVLTEAEEAMVVAFRRHTLLPLDDCLYALQPSIPHLTRSALHRCLQRHGISRLPDVEGDKPGRQKFKR